MYNKYKYHQQILIYLNNKRNEYLEHVEQNKISKLKVFGLHNDSFTTEKISTDLKIDTYRVKEALLDLCELGFVDSKEFKYSLKESTKAYIDAKYFKNKRIEYLEKKIINSIKNTFIIILGVFSIYAFIDAQMNAGQIYHNKPYKQQLQELQSEVKSIQAEQVELQRIQNLILTDSLFSK